MPPPIPDDPPALTLPAVPESVRTARRFVRERLVGCSPDVAADVLLLTSEVCTNCVVHARSDFRLRVHVRSDAVRVDVLDDDPDEPRLRDEGRGLHLVEELATDWGVETTVAGPGKVVWFEVRR